MSKRVAIVQLPTWVGPSLLASIAIALLFLATAKSNANYEGTLTVTEMSFTTGNANTGKWVLLYGINGVSQISVTGLSPLRLRGRFGTEKTSRVIELRADGDNPELSIEPVISTSKNETTSGPSLSRSNIVLESLVVNGGVRVAHLQPLLTQDSQRQLRMCLYPRDAGKPLQQADADCDEFNAVAKSAEIGTIRLNLGSRGVHLRLSGYKNFSDDLRLFQPDSPTLLLPIASYSQLQVQLPPVRLSSSATWIWSRGEVSELGFYRVAETNFTEQGLGIERSTTSTIREGKVRGFGVSQSLKELDLKPSQLLMFGDAAAQQRLDSGQVQLRSVELTPAESEPTETGLIVALTGRESILRTGTDPNYPVAEMWTSWLEGVFSPFPKELFIFVLIGAAGLIGGFARQTFDRLFPVEAPPKKE